MELADHASVQIQWDARSGNNAFYYVDDDGTYHAVWFLDAVTLWNQYLLVSQMKFAGMSFDWTG